MDKTLATKIVKVLTNPDLEEVLKEYFEFQLDRLRRSLELEVNPNEIYKLQGRIQELRQFMKLRADALATVKGIT